MAFKDKTLEALYTECRRLGADATSTFYVSGMPRRGAAHRVAYWNGRSGVKNRYPKNTLAYAAWKAGTDDRKTDAVKNNVMPAFDFSHSYPRFSADWHPA